MRCGDHPFDHAGRAEKTEGVSSRTGSAAVRPVDPGAARRWRGVRRQIDALDIAVFEAVANTRSPLLDATMPPLTRAADKSVLWMGVAGLLALTGRPRARRAAARGLVSIAITSLIANQVSKRLHRRPRPSVAQVPAQRLAHRIPTSTSFPSGHSASAMAFAAGVAAEWPALSVPLRALAGLVGFSRVATGAHYPSDVAAGFALGETVAWLTTRLVSAARIDPIHDDLTVRAGEPNPDGEGITLVINPRSGSGRAGKILPAVRRAFPRMRIVELGGPGTGDYGATIDEAAASTRVLAVAGGDGTVQRAASAAMHSGIPLAVRPAGTFNHFAKDLGMFPLRTAIDAIRGGTVAKVDLGEVNGTVFVNTASIGAYTDFVSIWEKYERKIGKPLAAVVAAIRTLGVAQAVRVRSGTRFQDRILRRFPQARRLAPCGCRSRAADRSRRGRQGANASCREADIAREEVRHPQGRLPRHRDARTRAPSRQAGLQRHAGPRAFRGKEHPRHPRRHRR